MIRPLRDLLVIQPEKTPGMVGLLHLPDLSTSRNKSTVVCKVLAAGPKVTTATVGSRVVVESYGIHPAGDEVIVNGQTLAMIRERDIVGLAME